MKLLLTGSSGFIGNRLLQALSNFDVTVIGRSLVQNPAKSRYRKEINGTECFSDCLVGIDVVIHTAARAHIMNDKSVDPLLEYRKINVDGTLNLAQQAARAGVKRFIFLSSIKVHGEHTKPGQRFHIDDTPSPEDAYAISKWEAEQSLLKVASETGLEVVIIRPPLVYGPGVKGNFASLLKLTKKRLPLPLASIKNLRSLVAVDNLVNLIVTCVTHPAAANKTFLASDGKDLSTTELIRLLGEVANKPARLIPVPESLLIFAGKILGKQKAINRLLNSLQVDISYTTKTLGWVPPVSVEEGLRRCFDETSSD